MANVAYVASAENRSHGSSVGAKLRRFCNGTRFRYDDVNDVLHALTSTGEGREPPAAQLSL